MKKKFLIIFFVLVSQFVTAQQKKIDSIQKLYLATTVDTLKIKYAYQLAELHFAKPENALPYANAALPIAERLNRLYDIAYGKGILASCYGEEGNYPLAVKNLFEALQISKQINNSYLLSGFYGLLGSTYDDQKDEQKAIYYTREQIVWAKKRKDRTLLLTAYYSMSYYYNKLGQPQQALVYDKLGNELIGQVHSDLLKGQVYAGMGHSYLMLKQPDIGLPFLYKAFALLKKAGSLATLTDAYKFTSDYYIATGQRDSAIKYSEKQLEFSKDVVYEAGVLEATTKLGKLYDGHDQAKAAFYYKTALELDQRLFDSEKTRAFQNLVEADAQRQRELAEQQRVAAEERKENLQLIAIALFIPVFIIVLFRLRRTRLHRRVIDFMGVLSLLLVFEFITLLSHPFIERITGHTPVLELVILVSVASILVPAHHQLTHWLKEQLAKPHRNSR